MERGLRVAFLDDGFLRWQLGWRYWQRIATKKPRRRAVQVARAATAGALRRTITARSII